MKLIYILGAGRSGSTLLERLFASAPGVTGVGEAHSLWRLPLSDLTCACGAPGPDCAFWAEARARAGLDDRALTTLSRLERRVVRHRRLITLAAAGRALADDPDAARFLDMQRDLFGALAEVAGAHTVVDSSKAAPRAWALAALPEAEILHLRRNPADVIAAWRREKPDPSLGGPMRRPPALAAAREWLTAELSAARLARRAPVARLDFDAFARAPRSSLRALQLTPEGVAWDGPAAFAPDPENHALNGNPDRFHTGRIRIAPPPRAAIGWRDRTAARVLGAALRRAAP